MTQPLKPCPFCDQAASVCQDADEDGSIIVYVRCQFCAAQGPTFADNAADAISSWNGRATADAIDRLRAERDEARAAPRSPPIVGRLFRGADFLNGIIAAGANNGPEWHRYASDLRSDIIFAAGFIEGASASTKEGSAE